jgi:hypothetical protein
MAHATDHAAKVSPACPAWQQHRLGRSVAHAYVAESRRRRLTQGRAAAIHVSFAHGPGQSGARVVRARVQDGTCTKEFRGHRSGVLGMAVHMGYMYTASSDCTIRVWSLAVRFAAAATTTFRAGIRHIGAGTRHIGAGTRHIGAGIRPIGAGTRHIGAGIRPIGAGTRHIGAGTRHIGAGTRHIGAGIRPTSAPGLALCPWRGLHTCVAARLDAEGCCAARRMGSAVTYCPATSALCSMSPHSRPIPACPLARLPRLLTSATLLRRRCRPAAQPEHAREFRARPGRCHARCLVIGSEKGADRSKAELYSASADSMVRSWNVSSSDQVAHGLYAWHPSEPTLER